MDVWYIMLNNCIASSKLKLAPLALKCPPPSFGQKLEAPWWCDGVCAESVTKEIRWKKEKEKKNLKKKKEKKKENREEKKKIEKKIKNKIKNKINNKIKNKIKENS